LGGIDLNTFILLEKTFMDFVTLVTATNKRDSFNLNVIDYFEHKLNCKLNINVLKFQHKLLAINLSKNKKTF